MLYELERLASRIPPEYQIPAIIVVCVLGAWGWMRPIRDRSALSLRARLVGAWRLRRARRACEADAYETGHMRDYEVANRPSRSPWFAEP